MVVVDATMLMLLVDPAAAVPNGVDGKPIERAADRVARLVADLDARGVRIVVPTPALAEVLVRLGPKEAEEILKRLGQYWRLRIEPFDSRAAVEVATMTRDALDRGEAKDPTSTWAKLKYDRQIVAIARVGGATAIYSDDAGIGRLGARAGIDVVGLAELPLPEPKQVPAVEEPLALPEPSLQMDLLRDGS